MKRIMAFFLSVILFFCGAVQGSVPQKAKNLRVVSYLVIDNADALKNIDSAHFKDQTDVILFGGLAAMNGEGEVVLCDGFDELIKGVKAMDQSHSLRWHLNLGIIYQGDQKMSMRDAFRGKKNLTKNIRTVLEDYEFDGVFFDYEFPMEWDAKLDFSLFLIDLDKTLGDDFLIGAALQPWCARFLPRAIAAIDMVELMCYDNWDDQGFHSTMELAKQDVRDMVKLGYKLHQIDLGLPFYARPTTKEARWYEYRAYWDKIDENGLVEDPDTGLIASFNTPELIYEKTRWAIETGLGGVMIWNYACDVPPENPRSLYNAITNAKADLSVPKS